MLDILEYIHNNIILWNLFIIVFTLLTLIILKIFQKKSKK